VAAAGALLGPEAGIAAALLSALLTALLWRWTDNAIGAPILTIGGNWLGVLALMGLGAAFGVMRVARGRLDRDGRRAGSLAEAASVLTSGGGPEMLRLLAKGSLDVVRGDAALLFLAVPGGGLELVAAAGVPLEQLGSRLIGDAVSRAYERGRAAVADAGAASIGIDLPRMRSAMVVPLISDGGTRGVLVVLAARRDALRDEHLDALVTYAAFVHMAIAMQLRSVEATGARIARGGDAGAATPRPDDVRS
jgi:GAF domain-containing protein